MKNITQIELKKHLNYEPETGVFTWINTIHKNRLGKEAGSINSDGAGKRYRRIHVCGHRYLAHHLAVLYMTGSFYHGVMDHIDGDGTNNAYQNLRCVNSVENSRNRILRSDNTSGVCGVVWHAQQQRWRAQIGYRVNGIYKNEHIGQFNSIEEAINARHNREKELGFHINHGRSRA